VRNTREFRGRIWAPEIFGDDYWEISWHGREIWSVVGRGRIDRRVRRLGGVIIEPSNFVVPPQN